MAIWHYIMPSCTVIAEDSPLSLIPRTPVWPSDAPGPDGQQIQAPNPCVLQKNYDHPCRDMS